MGIKAPILDLVQVDFDVVSITDEEMIKQGLADLKLRYAEISDPTLKEGYEKNREGVAVMRTLRGKVTAKIKEKKAPLIKQSKQLETIKKMMLGEILALEDPMKERNKSHDEKIEKEQFEKAQAENERTAKINEKIESIRMTPVTSMDQDSIALTRILNYIKTTLHDLSWADEKMETAQDVIGETISKLEMLITAQKGQEEITRQQKAEAKRLEDEKKQAEAKAQVDREEQDRKNKEDADRLARDRAKFEAEKKKARERQEALDAKIKKEADDKLAAEKLARDRQEEKALLDAENMNRRRGDVYSAFIVFVTDEEVVNQLVTAIIDGRIPHVTFR